MATCAGGLLGLTEDAPVERWLRGSGATWPITSGYVVLAGNSTAHAAALESRLRSNGRGSDFHHLASREAWVRLSCASGCPTLLDDVAIELHARDGLWSVLFVSEAEHAPVEQINKLVSRFWQQARCVHATAYARSVFDCRRVLFALSTSWGAEQMATAEARSRPPERLHSLALRAAAPVLSSGLMQQPVRTRLRGAVAVVLGEEPADHFAVLMARQDEERRRERGAPAGGPGGASASLPDASVFDRVVGQEAVVRELRLRLSGIASGADGGEDAHTFFFYGFPGTGKTYVAELLALAQHGQRAPPFYQRFSMQNYKTDEDLWKLVSPPCGVKGEGAFAALFANGSGCGGGGCGGRGPVVLFDEIEEARPDFMTSALVNAIDHRGFVEFYRKGADGSCSSEQAQTAGAFIVLTSNCFMDELGEAWGGARRANGSSGAAEVYAATRAEMDRRIFDEGLPCSRDGRASPFAARKMRDRMRGNVYPFLPLSDEQSARAFELQLGQRAAAYERSTGVALYWTAEYTQLAVRPARGGTAPDAGPSSLRKRIERAMRLDEASVERLYARASDECVGRGGRLRKLVLHIAGGQPAARHYCDASDEATLEAAPAAGGERGGGHGREGGGGSMGAAVYVYM